MALANTLKFALKKKLGKKRLFYVCRDVERAEAGLLLGLPNFHILTNQSELAQGLLAKYPRQIRLSIHNSLLDTLDLLKDTDLTAKISRNDMVLVFKPTVQIEALCHERDWTLINPPAALANRVEEKMSQVEWLGPLKKYLPDTKISLMKGVRWPKKKFILQFNRTHTGSGTILINSGKVLNDLKKRFPEREARLSTFIDGPIITSNNVVWGDRVLVGNISYQITGLKPFTDNPFATIGNDWAVVAKIISKKQLSDYHRLAASIGKRLAKKGWRGLFGIDAIIDKKTGKVFLLEINARQPASTSYESILQFEKNPYGATAFAAHLASLLVVKVPRVELTPIDGGAQIVQRVTEQIRNLPAPRTAKPPKFRYIRYDNTKPNSDLLRLQTRQRIMEKHNELAAHGHRLALFVRFVKNRCTWGSNRAGAFLVKNGRILLIKRMRDGYEYYSVPGGTIDKKDRKQLRETARREILEETGLRYDVDPAIKPLEYLTERKEMYYFTKNITGKARLGGPEKLRNKADDKYELKWVPIAQIGKINLLPVMIKDKLAECLMEIYGRKK
jgi:8-oxo-dGTP diphosphatase